MTDDRASEAFRTEHAAVLSDIEDAEAQARTLVSAPEPERAERIHRIVHFFRHELLPHAQAEERVLYEVADRLVPTPPPHRWTDSLRYEHTLVHAAVGEMTMFHEHSDRSPEALARFRDRVLATLGLVRGHLGAEENVVLDALDRRMTAAEFRREVIEPTERFVAARDVSHAH